jgi:hypothetical protein
VSQENVEIVRRMFAARERLDWEGFMAGLDPDIEWDATVVGVRPLGGVCRAGQTPRDAGLVVVVPAVAVPLAESPNRPPDVVFFRPRALARSHLSDGR